MSDSERDRIREQKIEQLRNQLDGGSQGAAAATTDGAATSPSDPVHVESEAHLDELIAEHDVVLADFYADWCGPCQMLEPIVESIAADTPAVVAKVDVDVHQGLAATRGIRGVPTLFLYADGNEVQRLVGMQQEAQLRGLIEQVA